MSERKPEPDHNREFLQLMAKEVEKHLPDNWGFLLLAAPFGDDPNSRMIYTSTMRREDAINVLKEFLIKAGGAEDWMKHIK